MARSLKNNDRAAAVDDRDGATPWRNVLHKSQRARLD